MLNLLKKVVGVTNFKKLRLFGYRFKFFLSKTLNETEFEEFLRSKIKIASGDTLFIHSSVDKLNISFSKGKILDILLKIVGKDGTLLFPAWHFNYRAEEYLQDKSNEFNVLKSFSVMGLLTEIARRHPKAKRSLHPTNSVVAIGKHAEELVSEHHLSVYPNGDKSPFYRLLDYHGKVVGIGEQAMHSLSFVHCIEDVYKSKFPIQTRTDEVFEGRVKDFQGNEMIVLTKAAHKNITKRNVQKYLKANFNSQEITCFSKGGSDFFVLQTARFYSKMENLTKQGITIYDM
ncbi:MAG: aminoglycoside 3-N-acetyltransferase [Saprospiraceae bacterium]|jgi:aminoglycoside 3-N-acetyltransferase